MIKTKDLVEFMGDIIYSHLSANIEELHKEYVNEIVARLKSYDKLIESIEKLCRDLSNGVDR